MRDTSPRHDLAVACIVMLAIASPSTGHAETPPLSLSDFMASVKGRLVDVRRVDLRQIEAREKLAHLNVPVESLAAIVSMEGDSIVFSDD